MENSTVDAFIEQEAEEEGTTGQSKKKLSCFWFPTAFYLKHCEIAHFLLRSDCQIRVLFLYLWTIKFEWNMLALKYRFNGTHIFPIQVKRFVLIVNIHHRLYTYWICNARIVGANRLTKKTPSMQLNKTYFHGEKKRKRTETTKNHPAFHFVYFHVTPLFFLCVRL